VFNLAAYLNAWKTKAPNPAGVERMAIPQRPICDFGMFFTSFEA
jgi:hypothetical protein